MLAAAELNEKSQVEINVFDTFCFFLTRWSAGYLEKQEICETIRP